MALRRRLISVCVVAAVISPLVAVKPAVASHVDGTWHVKDVVLHIFDCHNLVCGRIAWIKEAARRPSQCGRTIVWGLRATGPNEWTNGSITDPDTDTTYRLSATYEGDGTLRARIFKGVHMLGRTEILRRVDLQSFKDRC